MSAVAATSNSTASAGAVTVPTASERCLGLSTFCLSSADALLHRAGTSAAATTAGGANATPSANDSSAAAAPGNNNNAAASAGAGVAGSDGQTVHSRFYQMKQLTAKHNGLCQYVDIHRGLRDRIFIVSEHFTHGVNDMRIAILRDLRWCRQLILDTAQALVFLHSVGIVHRNLTLAAIRVTAQGRAKLCDYGVYAMTDRGRAVPFAVGLPSHFPPELLLTGPHPSGSGSLAHNLKADVWSFGVCLFELLFSTPHSQVLATAAATASSASASGGNNKSSKASSGGVTSNAAWNYIRHILTVLDMVQSELSEYERTRREQKRARRSAYAADLKQIQTERERATAQAASWKAFNTANPKLAPTACVRCRANLPRPKIAAPAASAGAAAGGAAGAAAAAAGGLQQPSNTRAASTGKRPAPPTTASAATAASATPVAPSTELCVKCQSDDRTSRDRSERERTERWTVDRAFERERHRLRSTDVRTSAALIQFIRSCLSVSTADRPSAAELLKLPFLTESAAAVTDPAAPDAAAPAASSPPIAVGGSIHRVVTLPVPAAVSTSNDISGSSSVVSSAPDLVIEKYLICSRCRLLETQCACTTPDELWLQIKSSNGEKNGPHAVSIKANAAAAGAVNPTAPFTPAAAASAVASSAAGIAASPVMTPTAGVGGDRKHVAGGSTPRANGVSSTAAIANGAVATTQPQLSLCCEWSISDVYYLWRTIGGSVESELARAGRLDSAPPIMRLPPYVSVNAFPHRSAHAVAAAPTPVSKPLLDSKSGDEKKEDDAVALPPPPQIDQSVTYESLPEKYSPVILPIPVRWINQMIANEMEREMKGYARAIAAPVTTPSAAASSTPANVASPTPTAAGGPNSTAPPTPTADTASITRVDTKTPPLRLDEKSALPVSKKSAVATTASVSGGSSSARGRVGSNARRKPNAADRDDTASDDGTASVVSSSAASDAGASVAGAAGGGGGDTTTVSAVERAAAAERAATAAALASLGIAAKNPTEEEGFRAAIRRVHAFRHLLKHYPATRLAIIELARREGIPNQLRRELWPVILGVETGDLQSIYDRHVAASTAAAAAAATSGRSHSGDLHQLDVDIPRCHQYHDLINSRPAHAKLRRILRAWLISNPNHSYWQGLDSVCAPLLGVFFDHEAMAFACLQKVYDSYLKSFLMPDNSVMLDRHMSLFCQLLSYEDPELALHLQKIGFYPSMYAIPWVFTLFSHILPLHQVTLLWDTVFLQLESGVPIRRAARKPATGAAAAAAAHGAGPNGVAAQPAAAPESKSSATAGSAVPNASVAADTPLPPGVIPPFPLFMAVAILRWLRTRLLTLDQTGCLMYFTNMTAVNVTRCMAHALHSYRNTPASFVSSHVHYDVLVREQRQRQQQQQTVVAADTKGPRTNGVATTADSSDDEDGDASGDDSDTERAVAASLVSAAAAAPAVGEHKRSVSGDAPPAAAAAAPPVVVDERKAANERARSAQQKERLAREQQMVRAPVLSVDNLIQLLRDPEKRNTVWVVDIRSAAEYARCHFGYAANIPFAVTPIAASAAIPGGSKPDAAAVASGAKSGAVSGAAPAVSAATKSSKPGVVAAAGSDKKTVAPAVAAGAAAAVPSAGVAGVAAAVSGNSLQWLERAGAIAEHVRAASARGGVLVVVGMDEEHEQRFALEVMRERFAVHVCVLQRGMRAVLERVQSASRIPNPTPISLLSDLLVIVTPPPAAIASSSGPVVMPTAGSSRRLV